MYPLIARWEKSGKSKKRFCEEVKINLHTFKYWLNKRNKTRILKGSKETSKDFVELKIEDQKNIFKSSGLFAEIDYPNGVVLRLHQQMNSKNLKELLKT